MLTLKPDMSDHAILRRHQNPAGLALRGVCVLMILVGLWSHRPGLILLALTIDGLNWLYMPAHDAPPEWAEQVLDMELTLVDMDLTPLKLALICGLVIGAAFLALGLWTHHFTTILLGAAALGATLAVLRYLATR